MTRQEQSPKGGRACPEAKPQDSTNASVAASGNVWTRRDAAIAHGDGGLWDGVPIESLAVVLAEVQGRADAAGKRIPRLKWGDAGSAAFRYEQESAEEVFMLWLDLRDILAGELKRRTAVEQRRARVLCHCVAYNWPHRPGGGFCRWPEAPAWRCTIPAGTKGLTNRGH